MAFFTWIGKEKVVNHDKEVPFRLLRKNKGLSLGERSENPVRTNGRKRPTSNGASLIVEGDNLEALKALLPFYYGKVKCIYIDPPYNTGNEKWVYNDRVNAPQIKEWLGKVVGPEGEDLTRHDKWLCMMYPRLKLLRDLLRDDGVIFISIDDNEHCNLKMIMDEIFGEENFLNTLIIQRRVKSLNSQFDEVKSLNRAFEYVICYRKTSEFSYINPTKKANENRQAGYWNSFWNNADRPTMRYEIDGISIATGQWKWSKDRALRALENYKVFLTTHSDDELKDYYLENKDTYFEKNGVALEFIKTTKTSAKYWVTPSDTTILDTNLMHYYVNDDTGKRKYSFDTAKNSELVKKIVEISGDKHSLVLDSFAGSGTTAQAVMELNKEDGGNRKFILVELEKKIAREITQERVRRVALNLKKVGQAKKLDLSFEYAELGAPLFNADGNINKDVSFEEMASYVYFTETLSHIDKRKIKSAFIGEHNGTEYYLLFKQKGDNVLNRAALKGIKKNAERKVVYADKCLLSEEILKKYNIVFRQIPYQVRIY